jgi:LPXTG-motif cell wall-anchored protein
MRGLTKGEKLAALAAGGALIAGGAYLYRRRKSAQVRKGARARVRVAAVPAACAAAHAAQHVP